jgi:uncharacterized membrane protein
MKNERDVLKETRARGLVKAFTYRLWQSLNTFLISWLVTGKLTIAATIVGIEIVVKIVVYFWHERIWNFISWGRQKTKDMVK